MKGFIETYRGVVYPWHCDHQGHLNTMHYVGMFDMAFWHHLSALGNTSVTGFYCMRNTETGDIAATSEKISVCFDLNQRHQTALPDDRAEVMTQNIVERED